MKILVVDDEELVCWFLDRALRKKGHEVITASNVSDASEKLKSDEDIDILFVDLRMPGKNGAELINNLDRKSRKPKIVVCSAFITPSLEETFKSRGIIILRKPFKLDELDYTIKQCLES